MKSIFVILFVFCLFNLVLADNICKETVDKPADLFAKRSFTTTGVPYVPAYTLGSCYGPFCDIGAVVSTDFFGSGFTAFPLPSNVNDPNAVYFAAEEQIKFNWIYTVREQGSGSLDWKDATVQVNLAVKLYNLAPDLYQRSIQKLATYTSQITLPPVLTTVGTGSGFNQFLSTIGTTAFDSLAGDKIADKFNCKVPRKVYSSSKCPIIGGIPGAFSQGRIDWNRFRTSSITALDTSRDFSAQYQSIMECIKHLTEKADVCSDNAMQYRVALRDTDLATENLFRSLWVATFNGSFKPTRVLIKGVRFLDPNALLSISLLAFKGANDEKIVANNYPDVFYLPNEYSQAVKTPGGWVMTAQLFGSNSSVGQPFDRLRDNTTFGYLTQNLSPFINNLFNTQGGTPNFYPQLVAEYVQILLNANTVLGNNGLDTTDITFQYSDFGRPNLGLPVFGITDATAIILNRTEGQSGIELPVRDEFVGVDLPNYAGAVPGTLLGTVYSSEFTAIDLQNVRIRAKSAGNVPNVINLQTCNQTDIISCPRSLYVNLLAQYQPSGLQYEFESQPSDTLGVTLDKLQNGN